MSKMFKESGKTPLGKLRTHSGTVALTDGIHASSLQGFQGTPTLNLDIECEDVDIPVYAILADGKRYILLALDEATPIESEKGNVAIAEGSTIDLPEEGTEAEDESDR